MVFHIKIIEHTKALLNLHKNDWIQSFPFLVILARGRTLQNVLSQTVWLVGIATKYFLVSVVPEIYLDVTVGDRISNIVGCPFLDTFGLLPQFSELSVLDVLGEFKFRLNEVNLS